MDTEERKKHRRNFWPLLLILVGGLWLASNLGVALDWGIVLPILVIALGFFYMFNPSESRGGIVAIAAVVFVLLIVSIFLPSSPFHWNVHLDDFVSERIETTTKELHVSQANFPDITQMRLSVDIGSGTYVLDTEALEGNYFTSKATYNYEQFAPELSSETKQGGILESTYTTVGTSGFLGFTPQAIHSYDLHLAQDSIPLDARLFIGSGTAEASFANKTVTSLFAEVGSGQMHIDLENSTPNNMTITTDVGSGSISFVRIPLEALSTSDIKVGSGSSSFSFLGGKLTSDVSFNVSVGSGKVEMEIPQNLPVIISADIGSGDLFVDGEKQETYTSQMYKPDLPALNITADIGSGDLNITLTDL